MKDNIMHAFGKTPDIFMQRVESTLLRLEERPMKKVIRKPVIIAIAVLITMIGIAAATGGTNLFNVFGRQPLDSAENTINQLMSEPVKVNDDITAAIDNYYYDGRVFIQIADTTGTVTQIFISDPIIDCGGVAVGDSVDAITSVYGEPSFQSEFIVEYKKDGMTLQFELENGKVSKIWYLENATVE